MSIENYNYARDQRTQGPAQKPKLYFFGCKVCGTPGEACDCENYECIDIEEDLPTKWDVCPVCDGDGKHVNPSIDAGGISQEQFDDDPDFAEQYRSGHYDQTCTHCEGRTTVQVVDWDALDPAMRKAYEAQLEEERHDREQQLSEIRMGA